MFTDLATKTIPNFFAVIDKRIVNNSSKHHIVGDNMTIADFFVGAFLFSIVYNEANEHHAALKAVFDQHEHLKHYGDHLHKEFEEYLSKRPSPRPF